MICAKVAQFSLAPQKLCFSNCAKKQRDNRSLSHSPSLSLFGFLALCCYWQLKHITTAIFSAQCSLARSNELCMSRSCDCRCEQHPHTHTRSHTCICRKKKKRRRERALQWHHELGLHQSYSATRLPALFVCFSWHFPSTRCLSMLNACQSRRLTTFGPRNDLYFINYVSLSLPLCTCVCVWLMG